MIGCVLRFDKKPANPHADWDVVELPDGGVNIFVHGTEEVEFATADSSVREFLRAYASELTAAAAGQGGELDFGVFMPVDAPVKSVLLSSTLCGLASAQGLAIRVSMYCSLGVD